MRLAELVNLARPRQAHKVVDTPKANRRVTRWGEYLLSFPVLGIWYASM